MLTGHILTIFHSYQSLRAEDWRSVIMEYGVSSGAFTVRVTEAFVVVYATDVSSITRTELALTAMDSHLTRLNLTIVMIGMLVIFNYQLLVTFIFSSHPSVSLICRALLHTCSSHPVIKLL